MGQTFLSEAQDDHINNDNNGCVLVLNTFKVSTEINGYQVVWKHQTIPAMDPFWTQI